MLSGWARRACRSASRLQGSIHNLKDQKYLRPPFLIPGGTYCTGRATPFRTYSSAAYPSAPLVFREAQRTVPLHEVLSWKCEVKKLITGASARFEDSDAPATEDLLREVDWVLDDCVVALSTSANVWEDATWKSVGLEVSSAARRQASTDSWCVKMRLDVPELVQMWHQRLEERVPFQYLTSTAHWREYILSVGPGVLIPRPETEQMVDFCSAAVSANPKLAGRPWLDLGTGSGAIAIGIADVLRQHHQNPQVYAVDLSPVAVAYAQYNAQLVGVGHLVQLVQGSWYEPVQHLAGTVGGIFSNPPYIPHTQMATLQEEVGRHEPVTALDGGAGPGLDSLQVICQGALQMLASEGVLALETAAGDQAEQVASILMSCSSSQNEAVHFTDVSIVSDCYGKQRFVTAVRTP